MSLAEFFQKQCTDKLEENVALALAKLADPSSLVTGAGSGVLKDAASGNMGGLAAFAEDYLLANSDAIALAALKATGKENSVLDALNLFYSTLAQIMAAYNDLILMFLKKQAETCKKLLDKKIALNTAMKEKLTQLVNGLNALNAGDPVYDAYLAKLRKALTLLDQGRRDIKFVRNNIAATGGFLPKVYRKGRNEVRDAAKQIKPPTDSEKIIVPKVSDPLLTATAVQHDGVVYRAEPNVLYSSEVPSDNTFNLVRLGDKVTILASTGGAHIIPGVYSVVKKFNDASIQLDKPIFKVTPVDAVTQIGGLSVPSGVNYYIKTIVQGVGAAIGSAIIKDIGIPTEPQQIENLLAVPKMVKDAILIAKDYIGATSSTNALLVFYFLGLDSLQTGMPDIMKKYVLSLFDNSLLNINKLVADMEVTVNGAQGLTSAPLTGFKPKPLNVSTHAFKWSMDAWLIVESLKLIPASIEIIHQRNDGSVFASDPSALVAPPALAGGFAKVKLGDYVQIIDGDNVTPGDYTVMKKVGDATLVLDRAFAVGLTPGEFRDNVVFLVESDGPLGEFALSQGPVNVYLNTVAQIKALGTIQNGQAALLAHEGQEEFTTYEGLLLAFLLEAAGATIAPSVRPAVISLGESLIHRCELSIARDTNIKRILQVFIDTPIPLEDTLAALMASLKAMLAGLGLDKAADLLENGDYAKLFGLNGKNATYLGAALEAIAFLKSCFDNEADKSKLEEVEDGLKGQKDLLNLNISINFDFAILKNLQDCLDLTNAAKLFLTKEFLCQKVQQAVAGATKAAGASLDFLEDLVSTDDGTTSSGSAVGVTDNAAAGLAGQTA